MSKSIVSYITSSNPFLKTPVVQKRESKTSFRNWNDKLELTNYIDSLPVPNGVECCLYIKCHCSAEHKFLTKEDIPDKNFLCKCGRNLIEYGAK